MGPRITSFLCAKNKKSVCVYVYIYISNVRQTFIKLLTENRRNRFEIVSKSSLERPEVLHNSLLRECTNPSSPSPAQEERKSPMLPHGAPCPSSSCVGDKEEEEKKSRKRASKEPRNGFKRGSKEIQKSDDTT